MTSTTEYFNEQTFHPSLDIKNNILVLGFRLREDIDKEKETFMIVDSEAITLTDESEFISKSVTHHIELNNRVLVKLAKRWSFSMLDDVKNTPLDRIKGIAKISGIFNIIRDELRSYVELDENDGTLLTAWIVGTYFFPAFSAYPYMHIKAPKGSGKTQCLTFLSLLCFNATKAKVSFPALRDSVDSLRGVYLMDQADSLSRPNYEDILDTLTDSYKKSGGDVRKMIPTKSNGWSLAEFEVYGPKAFASINNLPEDLRDRCLIVGLTRSDSSFKFLDDADRIWLDLRNKLYRFLIGSFHLVPDIYHQVRDEYNSSKQLSGRKLELWTPMKVIMRLCEVDPGEQDAALERFLSQYSYSEAPITEIERAVIDLLISELNNETSITYSPKEIAVKIHYSHFEDQLSIKQKSAVVGKIITKFNLSSKKLPRNSKGERYLFEKLKLDKIYSGYFKQVSDNEDTQTYIEQNEAKNIEDFSESLSE